MTPESFDFIAGLVKSRSGLLLTPDKRYMLESRLAPLLKREALADLDALALRRTRRRRARAPTRGCASSVRAQTAYQVRTGAPVE